MGCRGEDRTVVVGVDGSPQSLRAVRWGAVEAARRNAVLRLVSAFDWLPARNSGHPRLREDYRERLLQRTEIDLLNAAREAGRQEPAIEVDHQLLAGPPCAVLLSESRRADLVVVGDQGRGRIEEPHVGSVALALTARAACPVVVVRGPEEDPAETACLPVVVGVGSAAEDEPAVGFAFDAAATRDVPLVAVHTWWGLEVDSALAPRLDWAAIEADERQVVQQQLAGWAEKAPDVRVAPVVTRGHPARILLGRAAGAQLLVVAAGGRGERAGPCLDSLSNALIHRAGCAVAVVGSSLEGGGPDVV